MFRAYETGGARLVAVKVFRLDLTPVQAAALVRELEQLIARRIDHPAIARPLGAGLDGGYAYLAMEYAIGNSLEVTAPRGRMALRDVASIVDAVAGALDRSVEHGVHHDLLHPRDIITSPDGTRVTGLGIAEALSSIGISLPVRRPYAAPERPSDVYSLAAIAYELTSGHRMTPSGWDELSAEDGPELRNAFAAALSEDSRRRPRVGEFAAMLRLAAGPTTNPDGVGDASGFGPRDSEVESRPSSDFRSATPGVDVDVDAARVDRVADFGMASDLQMDFAQPQASGEPTPTVAPLPASWTAQPPQLFRTAEAESRGGRGLKAAAVLLTVVIVCVAGAYALRSRSAHQSAAPKGQPGGPPVTSTTVDLPTAPASAAERVSPTASPPAPAPRASAPSAPTASRPVPGAAEVIPKGTSRGRLLIRSSPAGATVVVNGAWRGRTPLALRDLPLGSYTIHLTREGYAAVDREDRLTAKRPSASLVVALKQTRTGSRAPAPSHAAGSESKGSIAVQSRPAGARVYVNNRLAGATPLAIAALPAGPAKVQIEMDGYQTWATTVAVKAGDRTVVRASLDRR